MEILECGDKRGYWQEQMNRFTPLPSYITNSDLTGIIVKDFGKNDNIKKNSKTKKGKSIYYY